MHHFSGPDKQQCTSEMKWSALDFRDHTCLQITEAEGNLTSDKQHTEYLNSNVKLCLTTLYRILVTKQSS